MRRADPAPARSAVGGHAALDVLALRRDQRMVGAGDGVAAPARIVAVCGGRSTLEHVRLDLAGLPHRERRYGAVSTALQVMLARLVYFMELARQLPGRGVTANAFYPGLVRSRLDRGLPLLLRVPARLAQPFLRTVLPAAVRAAADPALAGVSGAFLAAGRVLGFRSRHVTPEDSQRLWSLIERLVQGERAPTG